MANYTEAQAAKLRKAIASGALTVDTGDAGRVTYRSLAEMRSTLALMEQDIAASSEGGRRSASRVVMIGRSGF